MVMKYLENTVMLIQSTAPREQRIHIFSNMPFNQRLRASEGSAQAEDNIQRRKRPKVIREMAAQFCTCCEDMTSSRHQSPNRRDNVHACTPPTSALTGASVHSRSSRRKSNVTVQILYET